MENKDTSKKYYKNFLTLLSGNTLSQLFPFIFAPILARIFAPTDFAIFANFMAIVSMFGIVASGRLELAIPIPAEKEKAQDIAYTGLLITIGVGAISLLVPLFSNEVSKFYGDDALTGYLWLVPLSVISYGLLGLTNNWNLRLEKFKVISVGKVGQSIVNNGLAALLGYLSFGVKGLIIGWLLSQYVNIFILVFNLKKKHARTDLGLKKAKSTIREFKDFPLINSLHAFTDIFVSQFLLFWVISSYFGLQELGFFAVMHKYIRAPIALISSSVSQLFFVEASKAMNQGKDIMPIALKTIKTSLVFGIPFLLVLLFFGPFLFQLYLGDIWIESGIYAQYMIPVFFFMFIISPISILPILMKEQKKSFLLSVFGYSMSLIALFIGVKLGYDFKIAVLFYSLAFCLYYIINLVWFRSLIRRKNESYN